MIGKHTAKAAGIALLFCSVIVLAGCSVSYRPVDRSSGNEEESAAATEAAVQTDTAETGAGSDDEGEGKKLPEKDIYILFTSDVHCGVENGFGYAGVKQIRDELEDNGYETILVDDGDHTQGDSLGTLTNGEAVFPIMNALKYDVAIPGNHEFDHGIEQFLKYPQLADFPYISCNINKEGKLLFDPYIIKEAAGLKIAFVGVTTPQTLTEDSPGSYKDENGRYIYGFMEGDDGKNLYKAVQDAVDGARSEGADLVYLLGHLGNEEAAKPYDFESVLSNTTGIDVLLDGHSHDMEQVVMKNRDGEDVVRSACGYKLNAIGYSHIKAEDGSIDTNIWKWDNDESAPELLGIRNDVSDVVNGQITQIKGQLQKVVAKTDTVLVINDPEKKDEEGEPVRIVRMCETNLGDLCADAARIRTGADIGFVNGGGVRDTIERGDITYGDIMSVHPFNNKTVVVELTGQQIADALEWSVSTLPEENGGFLQVSGISFSVDVSVDSGCIADADGFLTDIKGERRVKDIMVGDEPIDMSATYKVAGNDFLMTRDGNGYTCFDGANVAVEDAGLDNQLLIDYIVDTLGGTVGEEYSDPYGQGRIMIRE